MFYFSDAFDHFRQFVLHFQQKREEILRQLREQTCNTQTKDRASFTSHDQLMSGSGVRGQGGGGTRS